MSNCTISSTRFDVIDITSDIQVLETMMAKDGIGDGQYTLFH